MHYFARFDHYNGSLFRLDTRIYLHHADSPGLTDTCIGAIIGKNPGSAQPMLVGSLAPLDIGADRLLPTVKRCFTAAYAKAGKAPPSGAFVRVWNLFYLCDADLARAVNTINRMPSALMCGSESQAPPLVWFAWGPNHKDLDAFKPRFLTRTYPSAFFVDQIKSCIAARAPLLPDFPRHTQGMKEAPVVAHLAAQL